jgi:hypothetical protein
MNPASGEEMGAAGRNHFLGTGLSPGERQAVISPEVSLVKRLIALAALALLPAVAQASVFVLDHPLKVTTSAGKDRKVKAYTLASDLESYTLNADYSDVAGQPGRVSSHWWAWTTGLIPIGMTEPSNANWYFQAFFNWTFDGDSLHDKAFTSEVVRAGGPDAMIRYRWDTDKVRATISFAMVTGSDKLLMFASYEPKVDIKASHLMFTCYPTGFSQPRARAITTAQGTTPAPKTVTLDLAQERWVLYEDLTPNRSGSGSAGMLIGSPESLEKAVVNVGAYNIDTRLHLKPGARSLAVALYDCPSLPDREITRTYFRATGHPQAEALGQMAQRDLSQVLPPLPGQAERQNQIASLSVNLFNRPAETWRPNPQALSFPWARLLPAGAIRTVLLAPRFAAWESMELARRLQLDVNHLYADRYNAMISADSWPYFGTTGVGQLPQGAISARAARLTSDPEVDLFLCAGLAGEAVPPVARGNMLEQIRAGKGLLLSGGNEARAEWPAELFAQPAPDLQQQVLAGLDWEKLPGLRPGDPGRLPGSPVEAYRYGQGRVVVLRANMHRYSCLAPTHNRSEGLVGILDRTLALGARAAVVAAGRSPGVELKLGPVAAGGRVLPVAFTTPPPAGARLRLRVQDQYERVLADTTHNLPLAAGQVALPGVPAGLETFADVLVSDAQGRALGWGFVALPEVTGAGLAEVTLQPASRNHPVAPFKVDLPQGGKLQVAAQVKVPAGARAPQLLLEVRDINDRLLARQRVPCPAAGGAVAATLTLNRPVTVSHYLDLTLHSGEQTLAHKRERFTLNPPYPLDDFTVLMWTYAGAPPVLQQTDRLCYEWGADMMDLCHMGGYNEVNAAREYDLSSRSGLRLLPYVTRLAGTADAQNFRHPGLREKAYRDNTSQALRTTCTQAAPYSPVAYTLGDENYLFRGEGEVCYRPETLAAFRVWLEKKYGTVAELNRTWATRHASFSAITPPVLAEAAKHTASLAPWMDHKRFMDEEFALAHEHFAGVIQEVDPGALVGWDGLLGYSWRAGYDFERLGEKMLLNQTYTTNWPQGEYVRSFKQPGALTGMWGNATADVEDGWQAFPWACLLQGDNSVWWWTSWGLEYIPFNPDLSPSPYGKWFFEAVAETKAGPGKLLLQAHREARVALLYNQRDLFAQTVIGEMSKTAAFGGDRGPLRDYEIIMHGLLDYGTQFEAVSPGQIAAGKLTKERYDALWLCRATCLEDSTVAAVRQFVAAGGTVIVDGGAGLLDGNGLLRDKRPLDDLLGVTAPTGPQALTAPVQAAEVKLEGKLGEVPLALGNVKVSLLEPGLRLAGGQALAMAGETPLLVLQTLGQGRAITLNLSLAGLSGERRNEAPGSLRRLLSAVLQASGVQPYSTLQTAEGNPPRCLWQARFTSGAASYLAVQQDFEERGLGPQKLQMTIPQPAIVYDLRAGKRVGQGRVQSWQVTVDRGDPQIFSLLPYEVSGLQVVAPRSAVAGQSVPVQVTVRTAGGQPGYHVVRLDVYAPGAQTPHRHYSQNIACERGQGSGDLPLALMDPGGNWRLELRDVASGVKATHPLEVQPASN